MIGKIVAFWKMSRAPPCNECDHAEAEATERCVRSNSIGAPLDLRGNIIDELPQTSFIGLEENLVHLNLKRNHLRAVPKGLDGLRLHKMDFRLNLISSLSVDDVITLAQCRNVDLSRNFIKEWPTVGEKLNVTVVIERLDLASNLLSSLRAGVFSSLFTLQSLRLSRNKIRSIESHAFRGMDSLVSLDLSKNLIRIVSSLAFHNLQSLASLSLARNEISRFDDGVFFGCDSLTMLNVSRNHIRTISDKWLFGLDGLRQLILAPGQIDCFTGRSFDRFKIYEKSKYFLPSGAFRLLTRLDFLGLSGNSIESFHKTAMTGLDQLNEYVRLDLSSNSLAVCLEDNAMLYNTSMPFLKSLKFRNNQLRVIPNRAFERFPALKYLDLADNPITTIHPEAFTPLQLTELTSLMVYKVKLKNSKDIVHLRFVTVDDSPRARIVAHPSTSVSTLVGEQARFSCSGYGLAPLHVECIGLTSTPGTINGHELVTAELLLLDVSTSDRAEYQCVVRNRFAAEHSTRSTLKIFQAPVFSNEPDDMSLLIGQNAKIMCAATGIPPPVIKWSKDGGAAFPAALQHRLFVRPNDDHLYVVNVTREDQHWTLNGDPVFVDGERASLKALGQILAIKKVQMSDSGEYACELWAGNDQLARQAAVIMVDFRTNNMLYGISKGMQQQKSDRSSGTSINELY
ncbi:unnamed protein product [Angiostrongylus costaricensis]|uniref:Ig-like domain-containing protein n=1 Tax=Angiostrongylus costaricensis TaxID=334426 RepID=A0A158PLR2_ANGCS|nr:unnamed protein product [Angiostrongylus costaricensis]